MTFAWEVPIIGRRILHIGLYDLEPGEPPRLMLTVGDPEHAGGAEMRRVTMPVGVVTRLREVLGEVEALAVPEAAAYLAGRREAAAETSDVSEIPVAASTLLDD